ncbi:hypothetical protein [Ferruginibacter sp. SUN106]|uniref:hypothetical protein n=1 Tax=Ferruginibacter sp. SUN106 TaxID=2978348 RepID=UPI003D35C295
MSLRRDSAFSLLLFFFALKMCRAGDSSGAAIERFIPEAAFLCRVQAAAAPRPGIKKPRSRMSQGYVFIHL